MSSSSSTSITSLLPQQFSIDSGPVAYIIEMPLTPALFLGREVSSLYMRKIQFAEEMAPVYEAIKKIESLKVLSLLNITFSEKQIKELMIFLAQKKQIKTLHLKECIFSETSQKIIFSTIQTTGLEYFSLDNSVSEEVLNSTSQNLSGLLEFTLKDVGYSAEMIVKLTDSLPKGILTFVATEASRKRIFDEKVVGGRKLREGAPELSRYPQELEAAGGRILEDDIFKLESEECVRALFCLNQTTIPLEDKVVKLDQLNDEDEKEYLYMALLESHFEFFEDETALEIVIGALDLAEEEADALNKYMSNFKEDLEMDQYLNLIENFFKQHARPIQILYYDYRYPLFVADGLLCTSGVFGELGEKIEICTYRDRTFEVERLESA